MGQHIQTLKNTCKPHPSLAFGLTTLSYYSCLIASILWDSFQPRSWSPKSSPFSLSFCTLTPSSFFSLTVKRHINLQKKIVFKIELVWWSLRSDLWSDLFFPLYSTHPLNCPQINWPLLYPSASKQENQPIAKSLWLSFFCLRTFSSLKETLCFKLTMNF